MNFNWTFRSSNGASIILGVLAAFLIQGCTTPLVKVETQTIVGECANMGDEREIGLGACSEQNHNGSATGFWNKDTQQVILDSDNLSCTAAGSKKCRKQGSGTNCVTATGKNDNCYSTYTNSPNPGSCFCACGRL